MISTTHTTHTTRTLCSPRFSSLLGSVFLLATGSALAQDDVEAEIENLEQAAEESAPAEPAPAAEAPAAEAPAPEAPAEPEATPPPAETAAAPAAAESDEDLDEVVVTVDRRKKDLQDYSGTAMAFSEERLANVGVQNVRDLASMVPGMQIGNQEGNTEVYIRGVGSDNNTELGDPAVAIHLDGIYLPRPRGMGAMFYDIARVEVNSGPQGTLRGRNALGGTVNIVSNEPKIGEWGANAEATFGTFAQRRYQGMVNIPIGDMLAFRFAGFSEVHDPHWENAGPIHDIKGPESIDSYSYRAQVKYEPSQRFSMVAAYDYTNERGTGWLGANFQGPLTNNDDAGTPDDNTDDTAIPFDPEDVENPRRIYNRGQQSGVDLKHWGARLLMEYDAGPAIISLTGSYRDMHFLQNNGGNAGLVYPDYGPGGQYPGYGFNNDIPDNFSNAYWDQASQSYVAELRVYAPDDSRFRWTVGGFMFDETQQTFLGQNGDLGNGFGGSEFPMPETNGSSFAGFADATFDVTESFRVIGGIRFTKEHKDRFGGMWSLYTGWPSLPNGDLSRFGTEGFEFYGLDRTQFELPENHTVEDRVNLFLDGIKSFGARDTIQQALCNDPPEAPPGEEQQQRLIRNENGRFECSAGVNVAHLGEGGFGIIAVPQDFEVDNTFFDWRAGVEYDLSKDSMVYLTASTGHKAGGFNDTAAVDGLFNSDYRPEDLLAFELGSKNLLANRKLRVNGSAFFYTYNDQVFQTIVSVTPPDPATGMGGSNTAVRQNAATSNMYGVDLDVMYRLPAGLEVELHALAMNATFGDGTTVNDSRIGFDVPQYEVDISGNSLPRVSDLTLNYTLSQIIFTKAGVFDWVINGQTKTQHYMTVFNGEGELLPEINGFVPDTDSYRALEINPQRLTDVIPAYTRFDAGAGWKHPDGRIGISLFVNNVFNTSYATSIIATPGLNLRFFNTPRTAGARFRVDW